GNDWNIRHRAGHCRSARERGVRRGESADARARRAPARRRAGALDRATDRHRPHTGTVMCPFTRAGALCLALLSATVLAAPPSAPPPAQPPRIVVVFANEPHTPPGPAGTTGSHYSGDGYR